MKKNTQRSDGRYQAKVSVGNGKYKYIYAKSNKELERKVTELKIKLGKGVDVKAEKDTFYQWAERWLRQKKLTISTNRYNICTYRINNLEPLHYIPISKIRTADIQDIIYDLHAEGLSEYVLNEVKNTAKQVLQLAIDNRVMDYNCALAVKIPPTEKGETRRALTEQEQEWITAPSDNRGHRMAMIMMYAGLRRGEMLALLWTDIDLENKTINVNKAVEFDRNRPILKPRTKTEAGMRTVYIPQILVEFLQNEKRKQSLIVCPNVKGQLMTQTAYRSTWNSYQKELNRKFGDFSKTLIKDKNGSLTAYELPKSLYDPHTVPIIIPNITAHMLRHTFITNMYLAGVDVLTAKEQAGHADIQTTLNIYTHLDSIYKKKEVAKLDEFFLRNDKKAAEK